MAAVGAIIRSRVVENVGVQIAEQILHWYVSAVAGTGATDQQIADAIDAFMGPVLKPMISAWANYRGVGVQQIVPLPKPIERVATAQAGAGGVAGDALPLQCSGLLTFRSPLAGKSNRGRCYIPFPGETQSSNAGEPTAGYLTSLGGLATTLVTPFTAGAGGNTNTLQLCIYSRKLATKQLVTTISVGQHFATQKRRGAYGRPNVIPF
jgi:hypothetical protein